MSLKCGIVGLPNVGKSTLFNALTNSSKAQAENFPFCTIDPNIGIVPVPDDRLENLQTASHMGWYTIWIHPQYSNRAQYNYVNLAFGNIKDALSFLEKRI